ncbi:MAG: hypothetical protein HY074_03255, partial [Deltaproteobacteria bacterium]|nr:hypothetical protein [Deltaproteobacteria bacterium]
WFPHVQAEAPPALAAVLAAIFIKTGAYAIVRVNYALFPEAANWFAPVIAIAGAVNIIYGGICALGQKDIRRLVAYSCVSHMGFVLLGLGIFSSTAFHGAFLQMGSHAVYTGLLFFLIGILGARSGHHDILNEDGTVGFGGLVSRLFHGGGVFRARRSRPGVFSLGVAGFPGRLSVSPLLDRHRPGRAVSDGRVPALDVPARFSGTCQRELGPDYRRHSARAALSGSAGPALRFGRHLSHAPD